MLYRRRRSDTFTILVSSAPTTRHNVKCVVWSENLANSILLCMVILMDFDVVRYKNIFSSMPLPKTQTFATIKTQRKKTL
jgi:hypothetical protein